MGGDVISCVAVEFDGAGVLVEFGDSSSNHSRNIGAAQFVNGDERRIMSADGHW